jgi:hypothetical protein
MSPHGKPKAKPLTDAERLDQLRRIVHLRALRDTISKVSSDISLGKIESNRGRQGKAIRMLKNAGLVEYAGKKKDSNYSWATPENMYLVTPGPFEESVREYAASYTPACGESTVRTHLQELLLGSSIGYGWRGRKKMTSINAVGWTCIEEADIVTLSRAYLHRDEFMFMNAGKESRYDETGVDGYPGEWGSKKAPAYLISKAVFESLPKVLIRNAAEIYASTMYDYLALMEAGFKGWSNDATLNITVCNVGHMDPTNTNFDALQDQCAKGIEVLKRYSEMCNMVRAAVERNGDGWTRTILSLAVKEMLRAAPAVLATDDPEMHPSGERLRNMAGLYRYCLEHASIMSYEALYDDREGSFKTPNHNEDDTPVYMGGEGGVNLLSKSFNTLLNGKEGIM